MCDGNDGVDDNAELQGPSIPLFSLNSWQNIQKNERGKKGENRYHKTTRSYSILGKVINH